MSFDDTDAMDWDSPVENEGNAFTVLAEDAECNFVVKELEKSRSENKQCPMAILHLELTAVDGSGKAKLKDYMILHRSAEWKLCEFFIAIGQRQHGQRVVPNWGKVVGATGRCTVTVEPWKNNPDKFSNKIKKYLEPAADAQEVSFG